jgi:enoyl-CoA hydratase/carnithine racemase
VHGIATAAGCQLVSMCDLAVAADTATFSLPGVSIGVFCSTPAVGVARNIGRKRAMEMLLTGAPIDAQTALAWGLVNRVVPATELDAEIQRVTDQIVSRSAATIRMGKAAFYQQIERPIASAYDVTSETMACNMSLEDATEGIDAFLQKRPAVWKGRLRSHALACFRQGGRRRDRRHAFRLSHGLRQAHQGSDARADRSRLQRRRQKP